MAEFMKKHNIKDIESFRSASNLDVLEKLSKRRNEILREIDELYGNIEMIKEKIDKRIERITNLKGDLNFFTDGRNKNKIEKEIE